MGHDCTRTWWGLHVMLNSKYWAMSILYWRYHEKKAEGMSTEDFANYFTQKYLSVDKYSYTYHKEVMSAWEDLKKRNESELARKKDLFNF